MKKTVICAASLLLLLGSARAQLTQASNSTANSGSSSGASAVSNPTVNVTPVANNTTSSGATASTSAQSNASNQGNNQTINFITQGQPSQSAAVSRQVVDHTSTTNSNSSVRQTLSGETTSNVNQNGRMESVISGEQTVRYEYSGTQTIKNVPNVNAAPLTSSNDTCMGSVTAGLAFPGVGLSGGSTYSDEHCKRIKMSRELWNKGMKAASLALDCMDRDAREALELTGFVCPQTARAQAAAAALQPVAVRYVPAVPAPVAAVPLPVAASLPPLAPPAASPVPETGTPPPPPPAATAPEPAPAAPETDPPVPQAQPARVPDRDAEPAAALVQASAIDDSVFVRRLDLDSMPRRARVRMQP